MVDNQLPDSAKAWVYQSTRKFSLAEVISIRQRINEYVSQWTSHKAEVTGWGDILHNRFVVIMADDELVKLGGCSIDSSVRFVKMLEADFSAKFFDRWNIAYLKDNEVLSCNREELCKLIDEGHIHDETIVFNNMVQSKGELLNNWQIPYKHSWLKGIAATNTSFNSIL
jgi:hypothetical protein